MPILPINLIESTPNILGGKPCIAGTRIRAQDVTAYHTNGSIERIMDAFDLTAAQVYAALSYYYDHREEIDADVQRQIDHAHQMRDEGKFTTTDDLRRRIEERNQRED